MIEDKELRDLFKIECSEHIQKLNDGLLHLEKEPKDSKTLEEVFREAHSLKGAARMVGVPDVETIAHKFEDILGAAKGGKTVLTSDVIDRLYKGLDSIQRLVSEAVTGEKAGVKVSEVLEQIAEPSSAEFEVRSAESETKAEQIPEVKEEGKMVGFAESAVEKPGVVIPQSAFGTSHFKIETVRVDTRILDMLMTQAGELAVTKTHIARRLSEVEEIAELWEEIEKKISGQRPSTSSGRTIEPFMVSLSNHAELQPKIQNLKSKMSEDSARLDFIAGRLEEGIGKIRLVPLSAIFSLYPRMVRDMAREKGKEADLVIEGGDVAADKRIIEEMKDPVMHMIRNSIDHGIEGAEERERAGKTRTGTIRLRAYQTGGNIFIEVSDDGKGVDIEEIKRAAIRRKVCREEELAAMTPSQIEALIFTTGFSTSPFVTEVSGRGVGLDVVRKNVERLKGTVSLESSPGAGCRFVAKLPLTLATIRVLIVEVDGRGYAIPVEFVETSRFVSREEIFTVAGRKTINFDGQPVSVARLSELLDLSRTSYIASRTSHTEAPLKSAQRSTTDEVRFFPCLILSVNKERTGLLVDALVDEQEVVLKPHGAILKHVRNVSGATILATGEVCMVLNPADLLKSVRKAEAPAAPEKPVEEAARKKGILLVEDSITTRTQEKRILEGAGYDVITAVDGVDAFSKLNTRPFDGVVSDIMMPNMDGLTLTEKIRQDKRFKELPVVLVTTLASDEDRKRGLEAGANAYIAKPSFDQKVLLEILSRLV